MLGIIDTSPGIGDKVIYTSLPENYYLNTGEKLIDVHNLYVYDYNPYILRGVGVTQVQDIWASSSWANDHGKALIFKSMAEKICFSFNLKKTFLRNPRLYKFEDKISRKGVVTIHTKGKSCGGSIPNYVIDAIKNKYNDYAIVQIGGKGDENIGVKDFRGLGFWETAEIIAESELFIGVNSAMLHIANAYNQVRKKVILIERNTEELCQQFFPTSQDLMSNNIIGDEWIDFGLEYFNVFGHDVGATKSYLKI